MIVASFISVWDYIKDLINYASLQEDRGVLFNTQ